MSREVQAAEGVDKDSDSEMRELFGGEEEEGENPGLQALFSELFGEDEDED